MTWTRYLLHDFWTARELNRIDDETQRRAASARRRKEAVRDDLAALRERVAELEADLGRATLLLRALADACVARGAVTRAEIAVIARRLDAEDGEVDGKTRLSHFDGDADI